VTDDEAIGEALAGTQRAYAAIVDRYQRPVYRLITRLVGEPELAAELAQDTFLKAFRRLESFDRSRGFAPWLLRIAHNTAVDALRPGRLETVTTFEAPERATANLASSGPGPDRQAEQRLMLRDVEAGLRRLRPDHRTALLLRVQDERSYVDIAYVMGVAEGTAKSYVHRARRQLAADLGRAGWGGATDGAGPRIT
jgi:RNA polymerase sigma-70 factor (ECF subfamily)